MAKPSAVTHLHLLCDQDLVLSREDDDELKEEEIVDDQRFGVVKATERNSATVAHSRAFLDLLEFWFNFEFWSSRIILFGWWENLHGFGIAVLSSGFNFDINFFHFLFFGFNFEF
ncbi:hypothetical protein ACFX13_014479 [Malus domestica]